MWYYVKQVGFGYLYLFFMDMVALGISAMSGTFIQVALGLVNVGLFFFLMAIMAEKEGEQARKVLYTNDVERRRIVETGEDRPILRAQEFKPYKGAIFGLLVCAPLIILLIIHLFIGIFGGTSNGSGVGAVSCYLCFYMPYATLFFEGTTIISWGQYFIILYCVPLIVCVMGIPYYLGGKKISAQYDMVKEHQYVIYGDKK